MIKWSIKKIKGIDMQYVNYNSRILLTNNEGGIIALLINGKHKKANKLNTGNIKVWIITG